GQHVEGSLGVLQVLCGLRGAEDLDERDQPHPHESRDDQGPEGWNPDISFFVEIMGVAKSRPPLPVGTKLWDAMQTVQESLNQGSGTPEGLLDEAQRYVDPTMQQFCPVTLPEGYGEPDPNFDVRGED